MSRPLRIEYPDAWYHVMNRGRRSEEIFSDKQDYNTFLELIRESVEMWNVRVGAYCLMTNHYHMLIQTPEANLSRCMRHINGVYTQRFNKYHHCDGQLFRGRYKSILVDADSYLLQMVRYIHRNPLRAGLVGKLDEYNWSSHKGYMSNDRKWAWLHKGFILSMLTDNKKQWRRSYKQFISMEDTEEISRIFERGKMPLFLGRERFIKWVKDRFFHEKKHKEVPESSALAPEMETIKEVVCKVYHINKSDLLASKRGVFNEPRNVAIYLSRRLRYNGLDEICKGFNMSRYSSASSAIERMKNKLSKNRGIRNRVEKIKLQLIKSQA